MFNKKKTKKQIQVHFIFMLNGNKDNFLRKVSKFIDGGMRIQFHMVYQQW